MSKLVGVPDWLRSIGLIAWLTTGVIVLMVGVVWLIAAYNAAVVGIGA